MIIAKTSNISEKEILSCLEKNKVGILLKTESNMSCNIDKLDKRSRARWEHRWIDYIHNDKQQATCFCKNGYGKKIKKFCPYCGNGLTKEFIEIATDEYDKQLSQQKEKIDEEVEKYNRDNDENIGLGYLYRTNKKEKIYDNYYVVRHPDYDYGIIIKKIIIEASSVKNELCLTGKMERYIEIIPGVRCKAYAVKRGKTVEMDLFKAFNLSSNTKRYDVNIDWEDANNMLDFLAINSDFAKRTAFWEVFNAYKDLMYKNSFFMLYMYVYSEYPVIEFLAKMNYHVMLNQALSKIANSYNRDNMQKNAQELTKVFNPSGTSGKLSLTVPKYVGDFLQQINADYSDFELWSDIFAYEPLSKENFEEYVQSDDFFEMRNCLHKIPNLQKYGYKLNKITKYIMKQSSVKNITPTTVADTLIDYRRMNELLGTTADEYPADVFDVHDKCVKSYMMAKNKLDDDKIKKVKSYALKYIPDDEEFTIVIPETVYDFIEEGNRQHNCVASYAPRVVKDKCFIFFVRRKEEPSINYITAEYSNNVLYQIREKNNMEVRNKAAIDYAKKFCDKLSKNEYFKNI